MHIRKLRSNFGCLLIILTLSLFGYGPLIAGEVDSSVPGVIDLSDVIFDDLSTYELTGKAELYWQQLLEPQDFLDKSKVRLDGYIDIPLEWKKHSLNGKPLENLSYVTYRLKLKLPKNSQNLSIAIREIYSAYNLYVDGTLTVKSGVVAKSDKDGVASGAFRLLPLQAKGEEVELVLQVSNYHHEFGGLWKTITIGSSKAFNRAVGRKFVSDAFFIGALVIICLYYFAMGLQGRQRKESMLFALFCFLAAVRYSANGIKLISFVVPDFPWVWLKRTSYVSFYLMMPVFTSYLRTLFPGEVKSWCTKILWIVCGGYALFAMFTSALVFSPTLQHIQYVAMFTSLYYMYVLFNALRAHRDGAKLCMVGVLMICITGVNDIVLVMLHSNSIELSNQGFMVFIFLQAILLSRRYSSAYNEIEVLSSELSVRNKNLVELDNFKNEFLANVSHELCTPLNSINGIVESMISGAVGQLSKLQSYNLRMVGLSTQRLINLVNDILDFAKLKRGDIQLKVRPTNLYVLVESVVEVSKTFLGKKSIQVKNRVPEDIEPIRADHNRLQQILYHLLSNAIEYTNDGTVEVYAEKEKNNLRISVMDTGLGISSEKIDSLFNYFEQVEGDITREHRGAGLGLAITKKLVDLHGGTIDVKSKLEIGTTFTFTMPISNLAPRQEEVDHVVTYRRKEGQYTDTLFQDKRRIDKERIVYDGARVDSVVPEVAKVLIVDDEEMNLWTLRNILSMENFEVVEATNGFEALDVLSRDDSFDLIILDLMMPNMSGFDVCHKIRETYNENQLPVLVLTAKSQVSDLVQGFSSGANDYLAKPFSRDELLARVQSLVKVKKLTSKLVSKLLDDTRREIDLDAAQAVQRTLLPATFNIPNTEVATLYSPAEMAGGDWYGAYYDKQANRAFYFIGDVTGHGVSSALVTGISSGAVYSYLNNLDAVDYQNSETTLKYMANIINRILFESTAKSGHHMTMAFVVLEYETGKLFHLSASHKPIYIASSNECRSSIAKGSLLGQKKSPRFEVKVMDIAPGDVLLLYTDGLSENQGPDGEKLKNRKIMDVLVESPRSTEKIKDRLVKYMDETWKGAPQNDDCSLMVVRWNGEVKNNF